MINVNCRATVRMCKAVIPGARHEGTQLKATSRERDWVQGLLEVSLTRRFHRRARAGMLSRKRGAILNIGSAAATVLPADPLYSVYAATKGCARGPAAAARSSRSAPSQRVPTWSMQVSY